VYGRNGGNPVADLAAGSPSGVLGRSLQVRTDNRTRPVMRW